MSLGENIYRLRTERNMSQGDLAEALEVSRQSISKWETDGAVPELDKLMKLAELFGVSLDELVTGKTPEMPGDPPPKAVASQVAAERQGMPVRTAVAIALFCLAFAFAVLFMAVGQFLAGLIFALPFLICGTICALSKKHPALWCAWAVFLMSDGYLRYATGLNWSAVRWTFRWEESWNYARLAITWGQLLSALALLAVTVVRLRKKPMKWTERNKALFAAGCVAFVLLSLPVTHNGLFQWGGGVLMGLATFLGHLFDSLRLALLAALLTALARGKRKG